MLVIRELNSREAKAGNTQQSRKGYGGMGRPGNKKQVYYMITFKHI